ncbi:hypothetical protein [Mycoplasma tauri]|nr:hypothetical protein [Mycoplasma tauri]MBZ4203416.1 hypothetical protein [Mycoplasma tauri]MBZ4226547.1 hypothetical protein [Mycoplasma tauri]QSB07488.1 hypothetical protein JS510_03200 [Mycoplasma tauri]
MSEKDFVSKNVSIINKELENRNLLFQNQQELEEELEQQVQKPRTMRV